MKSKSCKELANITTIQARMILRATQIAKHSGWWDDLTPEEQISLTQGEAKLEAALGERETMIAAAGD